VSESNVIYDEVALLQARTGLVSAL